MLHSDHSHAHRGWRGPLDCTQRLAARSASLAVRSVLMPTVMRFERAAFDPLPAQKEALRKILQECATSELGARLASTECAP